MKIELNLYGPAQMRAFAVFANACADAQAAEMKGYPKVSGFIDASQYALHPQGVSGGVAGFQTPTDETAIQNAAAAASTLAPEEAPTVEVAAQPKRTRTKKEAPKVEVPVEPAAIQARDEADEAEEAATATLAETLTHDSVRQALGAYVKKYGMEAVQADGPKVLSMIFGEGKGKVSDIPDTQEALSKAVAGVKEMLEKNPFKRTEVAGA